MTTVRRISLLLGAAVALSTACISAHAHAYLQRSEPPANGVVAQRPAQLRLHFSEGVEPAFIELSVLRNGQPVAADEKPQLDKDGRTVRLTLPAASAGGPPGEGDYEVRWRIVAKDGHPTEGRFTFRVGAH